MHFTARDDAERAREIGHLHPIGFLPATGLLIDHEEDRAYAQARPYIETDGEAGIPAIRDGRYLRALTRPFLASYGLDLVEIDKCRSSAEIERRGVCFDRCV